jgi:hypothetical protein
MEYKLVQGPVSYFRLEGKRGRKIKDGTRLTHDTVFHIFGDEHVYETKCIEPSIPIQQLLSTTFEAYPDETIDFFFEYGSYKQNDLYYHIDSQHTNYIGQLTHFFRDCFYPDNVERTTACKRRYPSVRFHTIDIRQDIFIVVGNKTGITNDNLIAKYILTCYREKNDSIGIISYIRTAFRNEWIYIESPERRKELARFFHEWEQISSGSFISLKYMIMHFAHLFDIFLFAKTIRNYSTGPVTKAIFYMGSEHATSFVSYLYNRSHRIRYYTNPIDPLIRKQCIYVPLENDLLDFNKTAEIEPLDTTDDQVELVAEKFPKIPMIVKRAKLVPAHILPLPASPNQFPLTPLPNLADIQAKKIIYKNNTYLTFRIPAPQITQMKLKSPKKSKIKKCKCITAKGLRCKKNASMIKGQNHRFCSAYHQDCQSRI